MTFIQYFVLQGCSGISRWRLKKGQLSENSNNSFRTKLADLIAKEHLWETRLQKHFQVVMGPRQSFRTHSVHGYRIKAFTS